MHRLALAMALLLAGCRDDTVGPLFEDFAAVGDLSAVDAAEGRDLGVAIDLASAPIDLYGVDAAPPTTITPGAIDRFLLVGTLLLPSGPIQGELLVELNAITCAQASCSSMPGANGATVIRTAGVIMPGMIDAHNHGLFNIFDESDWTPKRLYMNHDQWADRSNEPRYGEMVDAKQYLESTAGGVACEMDKYGEIKALIAGTTSMLVAATSRSCYGSITRTIDTGYNDLPQDTVRTSISVPTDSGAMTVCTAQQDNPPATYVVHVGEGIDTTAKNEFSRPSAPPNPSLSGRANGCLLNSRTTIVHGTALDAAQFTTMAQNSMGLVWSPKSNLFLYGKTTAIDVAVASGVTKIALGPDWALGGSINLLDELRVADSVGGASFRAILTPKRLFEMVTIDAARVLGMEAYIGSLAVGKRADVVIVGAVIGETDPYKALLRATPATVELTMVDGRVLYGNAALKAAGPAVPGCEDLTVCGAAKFVCAAETSTTNKLNQTYAQIKAALEAALGSYDTMIASMGSAPFSPLAPLARCN